MENWEGLFFPLKIKKKIKIKKNKASYISILKITQWDSFYCWLLDSSVILYWKQTHVKTKLKWKMVPEK